MARRMQCNGGRNTHEQRETSSTYVCTGAAVYSRGLGNIYWKVSFRQLNEVLKHGILVHVHTHTPTLLYSHGAKSQQSKWHPTFVLMRGDNMKI